MKCRYYRIKYYRFQFNQEDVVRCVVYGDMGIGLLYKDGRLLPLSSHPPAPNINQYGRVVPSPIISIYVTTAYQHINHLQYCLFETRLHANKDPQGLIE